MNKTNEDMPHSLIDADLEDWKEAKHARHFFGGLNGLRCGQLLKESTISLTWDSVTCQRCLAAKRPEEPWSIPIDTRGD